jgi:peptidylamidoglycolate lyase
LRRYSLFNQLPGTSADAALLTLLFCTLNACYHPQPAINMQDHGLLSDYSLAKDWPQLPRGYAIGPAVGIGIDSRQHVFIFSRAGREWKELMPVPSTFISGKTILEIDSKTGQLLNSWGDHFFVMPHGLTVDAADNIWVTDVELQQVFKFSHEGKLLMTLGEAGVSGNDSMHFNRPTGVAVAADGSFYVSDGYGNSRVVKFSPSGKYLFEWGRKGIDEEAFDIPHAIDLDDKGNVYVADRENHRIQIFDSNGKFIKQLVDKSFGHLCSVVFDKKEQRIVAVDDIISLGVLHKGSDIIVIDSPGTSFSRFGRSGHYNGPVCWYHDVAVDKKGNIYVVDLLGGEIQKFEKKK